MAKTESELLNLVRKVVQDELYERQHLGNLRIFGNWSQKKLGEELGAALMHSPIIVIDGRGITRISGHKPGWK